MFNSIAYRHFRSSQKFNAVSDGSVLFLAGLVSSQTNRSFEVLVSSSLERLLDAVTLHLFNLAEILALCYLGPSPIS